MGMEDSNRLMRCLEVGGLTQKVSVRFLSSARVHTASNQCTPIDFETVVKSELKLVLKCSMCGFNFQEVDFLSINGHRANQTHSVEPRDSGTLADLNEAAAAADAFACI